MTEATIVFSCVSLVLGFVLNGVLSHVFGSGAEVKKRLNTLENDRVVKLEKNVEKMQQNCWQHQNDSKLDVLIERIEGLKEVVEESKKNAKDQHTEFKQMVTRVEDVAKDASEKASTALTRADGHSKWISDHQLAKHGGK